MVLAKQGIVPIAHSRLSDRGCDKRRHGAYEEADVQRELAHVRDEIARLSRAH
jgi:hypothetical protein